MKSQHSRRSGFYRGASSQITQRITSISVAAATVFQNFTSSYSTLFSLARSSDTLTPGRFVNAIEDLRVRRVISLDWHLMEALRIALRKFNRTRAAAEKPREKHAAWVAFLEQNAVENGFYRPIELYRDNPIRDHKKKRGTGPTKARRPQPR